MLDKINYKDIAISIEEYLRTNTKLSLFNEGSTIKGVVDAFAIEISDQYNAIVDLYNSMKLSEASGEDLDNLASMFGIKRFKSVYMYTTSIKICPKHSGAITVPKNTIINGINKDGQLRSFILVNDVELNGECEYGKIRSLSEGYIGEFEPGSINQIDNNNVTVTNVLSVSGGLSEEPDDDLRFRIANAKYIMSKGTTKSIANNVLSDPNVAEVKVVNDIGSNVYFKPAKNSNPVIARASVTSNVADAVSAGRKFSIVDPIELEVHLVVNTNDNDDEFDSFKDAVESYINGLDIGQPLNIDTILSIGSDYGIVDTFKVFIHDAYYQYTSGYTYKIPLTNNIEIGFNEKFIFGSLEKNNA